MLFLTELQIVNKVMLSNASDGTFSTLAYSRPVGKVQSKEDSWLRRKLSLFSMITMEVNN